MKDWDNFDDFIDIYAFLEKGQLILKRKYQKEVSTNEFKYIEYYKTNPDKIPIVAWGITAFLSYENLLNKYYGESYRVLRRESKPIDLEDKIFENYFNYALNHLQQEERREHILKSERKSKKELIDLHIEIENNLFEKSNEFYNNTVPSEVEIISEIKKYSLYYVTWLKKNKLIGAQEKDIHDFFSEDGQYAIEICRSIFVNRSPKEIAIMLCVLSNKGYIIVPNRKRKDFYKSWYIFMDFPLPKNENYYPINQFIADKSTNGFVFNDETDMDYRQLKDKFDSKIIEYNKK